MTTKEFMVKLNWNSAEINKMNSDFEKAKAVMAQLGTVASNTAKLLETSVTTSVNKLGESVRNVSSTINNNGTAINVKFREMNGEVQQLGASMTNAGDQVQNFGSKLGMIVSRAIPTVIIWTALRAAIQGVEQVFQSSIKFMIDWETEMAKVRVVTGATKEQISVLSDSLLAIGEKFGVSSLAVAASANQWLRMGATLQTVNPLLEATAKLSLLSGESMTDSGTKVNSIMSAWGLSASEASQAIDKLLAVQSKMGVPLEVLFGGLSKVSVAAKELGVSFNDAVGYIAAVNEKSRATGEVIGTQLTMMFKKLGSTAIETAQEISHVPFYLDEMGKATTTHTQTLRDFNDILLGLAKNWNTLSTEEKEHLTTSLGGARQMTTVIALMNNLNAAMKASATSAQDSQAAIDAAMDTTKNKVTQLQDAWDKFMHSTGNTGWFKGTLDDMKKAVNDLTNLLTGGNNKIPLKDLHAGRNAKENPYDALNEDNARNEANIKANKEKGASAQVEAQTKVNSSLLSTIEIKQRLATMESQSIEAGEDKAVMLQREIDLWKQADGISQKVAITQIQLLTTQLARVQRQNEFNKLLDNEKVLDEQMKAEGASKLQITIHYLATLKEINATTKQQDDAQRAVDAETINQTSAIQDQIMNALLEEGKIKGKTTVQSLQENIYLQDKLDIHVQGIELLKQQLELYKAITAEQNKTPEERRKELNQQFSHSTIRAGVSEGFKSFRENAANDRASFSARQNGASAQDVETILHPSLKGKGGINSLQDELKDALGKGAHSTEQLTYAIRRLTDTISNHTYQTGNAEGRDLGTAVGGGPLGPAFGIHNNSPLTANQGASDYGWKNSNSKTNMSHSISLDLGGTNVTFTAHNKKELTAEVQHAVKELIQAHILKPGTKLNKAVQDVIDKF
jgi:TP901 family phage tail tape measure protein